MTNCTPARLVLNKNPIAHEQKLKVNNDNIAYITFNNIIFCTPAKNPLNNTYIAHEQGKKSIIM